ncbi:hypothetical protein [Nannocystis bainbridge]|uniref:Right handed beta helix domain-containing protein n=1 Tax=Nannocystis bainbridge TaxID=2995303 RepID=A0ABT5EBM7_9BACT|nr:hypothetical protein [Nannocystis bainbridge]MDC0722313.1 hypothetical protein [Nannocystis bainbridge]
MRRVVGSVVMVLACGPGPADESAGITSAFTSSTAGEEASAPTTAITTGGETFVGCDIVLRGDVDDTASVQAALDGASDGATICFEGVFALGPIHGARRNALGILVVGSTGVALFGSDIEGNDGDNFAPPGTLAAAMPPHVGVMVLASDAVEVHGNAIADNPTTGVAVVSLAALLGLNLLPADHGLGFDGYPETVDIHDNLIENNGLAPAELFRDGFMLDPMAQLAWDGVVDLAKDNGEGQLDLCIRANGDADFVDFDALGLGAGKSFDLAPHDCAHPPLPPVEVP